MNDYQEMYLHMFRAVEKAVRLLQQAQTECEALYISKESPAHFVCCKGSYEGEKMILISSGVAQMRHAAFSVCRTIAVRSRKPPAPPAAGPSR